MDDWKRLTLAGNRCFERGDLTAARRSYQEALVCAERWLAAGDLPEEAVAAFVITHQNLAEVFLGLDDCERAFDHLRAAYGRLLRLLQDCNDRPRLQEAALRQCHRARLEMFQFARTHGLTMSLGDERHSPESPAMVMALH